MGQWFGKPTNTNRNQHSYENATWAHNQRHNAYQPRELPARTYQRVEVNNAYYPRNSISVADLPRIQYENKRKRNMSYGRKVSLDIEMFMEILQSLQISDLNIPLGNVYSAQLLLKDSMRYRSVISQFRNRKFNQEYNIKKIAYIWNPYIFAQFKLKELASGEEVRKQNLFHGTYIEHLVAIATNNFDWRKVVNGKCGWGISFANNPWYSSFYSTRYCRSGNDFVMILAKVLVGHMSYGDSYTRFPPQGDTTTRIQDRQVLVKYDDASFYPEYIVYFERKRETVNPYFYDFSE